MLDECIHVSIDAKESPATKNLKNHFEATWQRDKKTEITVFETRTRMAHHDAHRDDPSKKVPCFCILRPRSELIVEFASLAQERLQMSFFSKEYHSLAPPYNVLTRLGKGA